MRFAICNETFEGWEWKKVCAFVAATGYDGVEIAPFTFAKDVKDITSAQRAEIKKDAELAGLDIVGLHWLLVSPEGLHLTADDADLRRRTREYLCSLVDFASDVGAPVMIFGSPKQRNLTEGVSLDQARAWAIESVGAVGRHAEGRGVTLCMEALPSPEANWLHTMGEVKSLVEDVDHPHVQMMMDVKSACSEGLPLDQLYRDHAPLIKHVHANDENRRGPGFGDTDFVPLLRALVQGNYEGVVSVEVFDYSPDPETIAKESLAALRQALASAES